jgi:phosphate starvation-inducible protein PhoH
MVMGRLGQGSIMIFCGDHNQIDLKNKKDSAYYMLDRFDGCKHVLRVELKENHRHSAVAEVLKLLEG